MSKDNKTFSLLFCDLQTFLAVKNKIVKIKAMNHEQALDVFIDEFNELIINSKIMTFCYEEASNQYGYTYEITTPS